MGKLVEKLQHISQSSSSGFGFFGRARGTEQKPRPAAIVVTVGAGEVALAAAALKGGADAILLTDWAPGMDLKAIAAAAETAGALWGVELAEQAGDGAALKSAHEAGASFVLLEAGASAQALFDENEKFDRLIAIDPPRDELGLMMLRSQNLLPVQATLLRLRLSAAQLARLTIADFTRMRMMVESLQFPSLVLLAEPPENASVQTLIRLGAAGLVLPGAADIAARVQALREELERTPIPREDRGSALLGGLMAPAVIPQEPQQPQRRQPEREPEREPEHE